MIKDKDKAIEAMSSNKVDFDEIDRRLLDDKDVVRAYIFNHSSNIILESKYPIDIDKEGMIDNERFIKDVIRCLDIGYSKSSLEALLRFSAFKIIRNKINKTVDVYEEALKVQATRILRGFNSEVLKRDAALSEKQEMLARMEGHIEGIKMKAFEGSHDKLPRKKYSNTNIGFTADLSK